MLLALLAAAGALWIRVASPFLRVFRDGWTNFDGDAWYHVRAIEHLVRNFPHRIFLDPYAGPGAPDVSIAPLFDYLVASTAMIAGLGAPSTALVERIAAFAPAVLGAAATLLIYAIGARLFDRRSGVLAAALLAIMPGPFLDRTLLGAADHHALEVVLVLGVIYCVARACPTPADPPRKRAAWIAGLLLGAYYLTWTSAPLFAFALAVWAVIPFALNRARSRSNAYLGAGVMRMAGLALIMVAAGQNPALFRYRLQLVSLAGLLALGGLIAAAERRRFSRRTEAALAIGGVLAALAGLTLGVWHLPAGLVRDLARFAQGPLGRTVSEMQPLLTAGGAFSLAEPWRVFRTAFYIGVPALFVLGVQTITGRDTGPRSLLAVWGALALAATLAQVRFGYYLSPILALLTGWACSAGLAWIASHTRRGWAPETAIAIIAAAVFYPSLRLGLAGASADAGMPDRWKRSLDWLRAETPDPFGNPDAYFQRYDRGPLPRPAYYVMDWWDYGYWIIRAGRRVPIATPTQDGAAEAARFFAATSEDDAVARAAADQARYVIVDSELGFNAPSAEHDLTGKFDGVVRWAGRRESDFFETLLRRGPDGHLSPVVVFFPEYYRSMAVRLSRFPVGDVRPSGGTWVVSVEERTGTDGRKRRELAGSRQFASYEEAEAYRAGLGPGEHRIVGLDPERPCVPLPALRELQLVHEEPAKSGQVRIFLVSRGN